MRVHARTLMVLITLAGIASVPFIASADVIESFATTIRVMQDGSAKITEEILYDFGEAEHHGIYRDIPVTYTDSEGKKQSVTIDSITVTDAHLAPYEFESFKNGDTLRVKIGDPDVLVTGKKIYEISYTAHDVVGFFPDHDELYWNVTGEDWRFPIHAATARVYAPASTTGAACYLGRYGATDRCGAIMAISSDGSALFFDAGRALEIEEGLTIGVGWPKGFVDEPSEQALLLKKLIPMSPLLIPIFAFCALYYRWHRHGRDEKGRGTIVPEYDAPKGINAVLTSMLMYERVNSASFSATIIELAVRGYLTIHREEEKTLGVFTAAKYRFDKKKAGDVSLSGEEKIVYDALFKHGDSVWSTDTELATQLVAAKSTLSSDAATKMVALGYYRTNPTAVKVFYIVAAFLVVLIGFFLAVGFESAWFFIGFLLTGILVALFGLIMPAKTKKGALMKEQILGLKEYLQIAEKDRLDFHHAPEKSPALFEKLLPYAMVLGVSAAWAKEFEGMQTVPPSWYSGASYAAFTPVAFADDMSSLSSSVTSLATPTSGSGGSGGGGFSGGGFGGGGGGSW